MGALGLIRQPCLGKQLCHHTADLPALELRGHGPGHEHQIVAPDVIVQVLVDGGLHHPAGPVALYGMAHFFGGGKAHPGLFAPGLEYIQHQGRVHIGLAPGIHPAKFPFISEQKYNIAIKRIFQEAGVDRIVTILDPLTHEEVKRPIYEVASSHLARRTFIGNIYKKVKDPNLVSALSGHKEGSKAFRRYRDIDDEMKKDLVKLLD